jgi:hypothetical protein
MSISAGGLLRQALRRAGRQEKVVTFPDLLAHGPINPPDPAARVEWLVSELRFARKDWDWLPEEVEAFWAQASDASGRRVVWTSSRSANEHAAFLHWVERAGEEPYEFLDLGDIEVERRMRDGRTVRDRARTLGMVRPDIIAAEALWDRAANLDPAERARLTDYWRVLQRENAPLRWMGTGGLRSAPLSILDGPLMSHTGREWTRTVRVIGHTLAEQFDDHFQVGDHILAARLATLVRAGEVECRVPVDAEEEPGWGLADLPRNSEVRCAR